MVKFLNKGEVDLKGNYLTMILLMVSIFLLSACSNVEKIQHIEVFVIETSEQNDNGFFLKQWVTKK